MNQKRRVDEHRDALEYLVRNAGTLPLEDLQARIRQVSKQAIADGGAAEQAGRYEEASALYEVAAQAFRRLGELAAGELRASELATAEFWDARAELVSSRRDGSLAGGETPQPTPKSRAIHTPKPMPLPPQTSIRREQAGGLSGPLGGGSRKAERFERPRRKQVGEREDQVHDSGTFRKREEK